jgi:hypothetical protein
MTTNLLPLYKYIEVMQSVTLLEIITFISSYKERFERGFIDTQPLRGMTPPLTIPNTIQRLRIIQRLAQAIMSNTFPNQIPSHTASSHHEAILD